MTLTELEQASIVAMKARDSVSSRTLRMLLARLKNERISAGHELETGEIEHIIQSEYKRRKEAAAEFEKGNRQELAQTELEEADVLARFLPAQVSAVDIAAVVDELVSTHGWTSKDFGVAMKSLKDRFGASADGSVLAQVLKEKLN